MSRNTSMIGFFLALMILMVGCADSTSESTAGVEIATDPYVFLEAVCINGVVYYFGYHRMAPAFNPDGSVKTCENTEGAR